MRTQIDRLISEYQVVTRMEYAIKLAHESFTQSLGRRVADEIYGDDLETVAQQMTSIRSRLKEQGLSVG